jgi:hypothetical protein
MNYKKIYDEICNRAKLQFQKRLEEKKSSKVYYEGHHIIPVCIGGLGSSNDYKHPNIVLLSAKEHFIAHLLLCEIFPNENKLKSVAYYMCNQNKTGHRYKPSSRTYKRLREDYITILKSTPKTPEHLEAIKKAINRPEVKKAKSEKTKNRVFSEDHKEKLKDRWKDLDTRNRVIESMKNAAKDPKVVENRVKSAIMANQKIKSQPDVTCPHCGKSGKYAYLAGKHFSRCKNKPIE